MNLDVLGGEKAKDLRSRANPTLKYPVPRRQYNRLPICHYNGMLMLRHKTPIPGSQSPTIGHGVCIAGAGGDEGFHRYY